MTIELHQSQRPACSIHFGFFKNFPQYGFYDCEASVAYYNFFCRGYQYATNSSLRKYGIDAACRLEINASLNTHELGKFREAFAENKHPRFMKEFSFHDPYGKSKFYKEAVENADLEKLTKLIGICAMLLQTKAHLSWG
jgi:hypothetical protein